MGILLAILALSFLIIIHELGHFLVAKAFKVKVNEFSLFMGPKLFSFQKGETVYSLRLIPLGGYVKMEGEEEASEDDRAFNKKPIGVRAAIIAAGPIMNIIIAVVFAFIIMAQSGFYTNQVKTVLPGSAGDKAGIQVGDTLEKYNGKNIYQINDLEIFAYPLKNESIDLQVRRNGESRTLHFAPDRMTGYKLGFAPKADDGPESNVVENVADKSPAMKAGVKDGDRIIKLNGSPVSSKKDIADILGQIKQNDVTITVDRGGKVLDLKPVVPIVGKNQEYLAIGIDFEHTKGNAFATLGQSIKYNISIARSIYYSLGWLFTGTVSPSDLMGPVGITTTIKDVVQQAPSFMDKFLNLLSFTAMISLNLGLVNLIPFPALDGSKLVLLLIEGIRKKPLNPEKEAMITMVGFVFLIMLMIYATFNDILRIGRG
jgi:regulator of sigma E protease